MQQSSRVSPIKKRVILFLAANPPGTPKVSLDEEAHAVQVELKRSGHRDRFDFVTRWAARPLDLLRELRDLKPAVVHFAGHGGGGRSPRAANHRDVVNSDGEDGAAAGLYFHGANGGVQVVSAEAIAQTLGSVSTRVQLVVLNACYSASIADALLAQVDCIVGMTGAIRDDAARSFAIGFYGALGDHETVATAFMQGRAAIKLDGLPNADQPQLRVRDGLDATQLIPAALQFTDAKCPYPGMRPFEADDAYGFYGREVEIKELTDRLRAGEREVLVIGPSGSGKSSLVKAGVFPRLAHGLSGRGPFIVRELRPGSQPAARLAQALGSPPGEPLVVVDRVDALLAQRGPGASLLIFVDQLEELFTQADAEESKQFIDALRALRSDARCGVVFTLRADFFGAFMESTLWSEQRGNLSRVEVSPLRDDALREAIAAPAEKTGVTVEPNLIERLVADAASEPGILPLLQDTLVQLWDAARKRNTDPMLTVTDYKVLGDGVRSGLAVALAHRADATLQLFTVAETTIARRILLRLISFGDGRPNTRQQQPRSKLCASDEEARVLSQLIEHRLLTSDEDDDPHEPRIDLAHEAMIAAWSTLAQWIHKHRADEQRRRQLEAAAAQWIEHGRGARGLLDPIELADAEQWRQTDSATQLGHSADVVALIAASRIAHTKQRRRRGITAGGAAVALAIGLVAYVTGLQREQARTTEARVEAEANLRSLLVEQGTRSLLDDRRADAALYLSAALGSGEERSLRISLADAMEFVDAYRGEIRAGVGPITRMAVSPDGELIALLGNKIEIWSVRSKRLISTAAKPERDVGVLRFTPDSKVLLVYEWELHAIDTTTGRELRAAQRVLSNGFSSESVATALGANGAAVVTCFGNRVVVLEALGGDERWSAPFERGYCESGAISEEGDTAAIKYSEGHDDERRSVVEIVDRTGVARTKFEDPNMVETMRFTPEGELITINNADEVVRWTRDGRRASSMRLPHHSRVTIPAVTRDSAVILGKFDVVVWRYRSKEDGISIPVGARGGIECAMLDRDARRIAVGHGNGEVTLHDAKTGRLVFVYQAHEPGGTCAAFAPDGTIVSTGADGVIRRWTQVDHRVIAQPHVLGDASPIAKVMDDRTDRTIAVDPKGAIFVSWSGPLEIWDATSKDNASVVQRFGTEVMSFEISRDGRLVAIVEFHRIALGYKTDSVLHVYDRSTGRAVFELTDWDIPALAFDSTGQLLAIDHAPDNRRHEIAVVELSTARSRWKKQIADVSGIEPELMFLRDGSRIAWRKGGEVREFEVGTGHELEERDSEHMWTSTSRDRTRTLVQVSHVRSSESAISVLDAQGGKIATLPADLAQRASDSVMSPSGRTVAVSFSDGSIVVWNPDAKTIERLAFQVARAGFLAPSLAYLDDQRLLVSDDARVTILDLATGGSPIGRFALSNPVGITFKFSLAVSSDATRVVTADDREATIWNTAPESRDAATIRALVERLPWKLERGRVVARP